MIIDKRTAVVLGEVTGIGKDSSGAGYTATVQLNDSRQAQADLNLVNDVIMEYFQLRAADPRWLGKRARVTVTLEVAD